MAVVIGLLALSMTVYHGRLFRGQCQSILIQVIMPSNSIVTHERISIDVLQCIERRVFPSTDNVRRSG
jgi:hypothetical protein